MLSLGKVRELLADSASTLEDRELENLRDQLYRLAGQVVRVARYGTAAQSQPWDCMPPDLHEEIEERVAIMEFDGGLSPEAAAMRAFQLVRVRTPEGRR